MAPAGGATSLFKQHPETHAISFIICIFSDCYVCAIALKVSLTVSRYIDESEMRGAAKVYVTSTARNDFHLRSEGSCVA